MPNIAIRYECESCGKLLLSFDEAWKCEDTHKICRLCQCFDVDLNGPLICSHGPTEKELSKQTGTCNNFTRKEKWIRKK